MFGKRLVEANLGPENEVLIMLLNRIINVNYFELAHSFYSTVHGQFGLISVFLCITIFI